MLNYFLFLVFLIGSVLGVNLIGTCLSSIRTVRRSSEIIFLNIDFDELFINEQSDLNGLCEKFENLSAKSDFLSVFVLFYRLTVCGILF